MTILIDQAIGLSVVLTAVLAAAFALRRHSAALRHWVIAAGVLSALALPAARFFVPRWTVAELPSSIDVARGSVAVSEQGGDRPNRGVSPGAGRQPWDPSAIPSAGSVLVLLWAVGAAANALVLLAGIGRLAWHARHARTLETGAWRRAADRIRSETGLARPVTVVETASPSTLGAFGWRRPRVLLPRGAGAWADADIDVVLRHELAHVARGDWAIQLAAEALRVAHWFNPLAWIACARLRLESERACDDQVLGAGVRGDDYAARLVALAARLRGAGPRWAVFPAPGMARSTSLQRRVLAMLNPALDRAAVTTRTRLVVGALAFALALPIAGLVVLAQGPDRFSGSVLDPSGRNVANARIVLTDVKTKARHEIRSDEHGRFELAGLAPGDYDMEVTLPGFSTVKGTVTVAPGGLTRDVKLQLGSLQETIVVSAKAAGGAAAAGQRTAPRRAPDRPPCVPTAMGGNVQAPVKLTDERPVYPEGLASAKVAGLVVVEGILAGGGTVRDLRVVQAPHPDLGASVVAAVSKWRFTPTLLDCEPADVKIKVDAKFVLD